MSYIKQTWTDRLTEFFRRFSAVEDANGNIQLADEPGTVTQEGTSITAAKLNHMEDGIDSAHADIGSRTYTEQNYVTDGETVTDSIDALDVSVNAAFDAIDDTIGSQIYTEQNYVTDGESVTASIDALDIQLKKSFNATDILSSLTMMPGYSINTAVSSLIVFDRFLIFSIGVAKEGNHTVGAAQFAALPLAYSPVKTKVGTGISGSGALVSTNIQWTISAKSGGGSSFNALVETPGLSNIFLSGVVYLDG